MYGRVDRHACPRRGVGWKEEEAEDEYTEDGAEEERRGGAARLWRGVR